MKGIISHEKRNMWLITLFFTFSVLFVIYSSISSEVVSNGSNITNFYGNLYEEYGNLFLGTLNEYYQSFILILMVPISFIAVMQYRESSISKSREFLMQLPVKRKTIFMTRTIIGMMTYTIPWLFFSAAVIILRLRAQTWYEMKLSVCTYGQWLLGNDSIYHLCVYLLFIWISLTLIYSIAVFFQNICKRPWIAGVIGIGSMVFPYFINYEMMNILSWWDRFYKGWWLPIFFGNGLTSQEEVWDKGVHQNVHFAVFDHLFWVLLIQMILIIVFFALSFYTFKKSDIAKSQNFMYFSWMEQVFMFMLPFCVALYIIVSGFKVHSLKGAAIAFVVAAVIYFIVKRYRKRRGN